MQVDAAWMSPVSAPPGETKAEITEPGTFQQILSEQQNMERGEVLPNQPNAAGILPDFTLTAETTDLSIEGAVAEEMDEKTSDEVSGLAALVQSIYWQARPQELPMMAMATLLGAANPSFTLDQVSLNTFAQSGSAHKPISVIREMPAPQREGFVPEFSPTVSLDEAAPFLKVGVPVNPVGAPEGGVEIVGLTASETPQSGWDAEMSTAVGLTKIAGSIEDSVKLDRGQTGPLQAQTYSPKVAMPMPSMASSQPIDIQVGDRPEPVAPVIFQTSSLAPSPMLAAALPDQVKFKSAVTAEAVQTYGRATLSPEQVLEAVPTTNQAPVNAEVAATSAVSPQKAASQVEKVAPASPVITTKTDPAGTTQQVKTEVPVTQTAQPVPVNVTPTAAATNAQVVANPALSALSNESAALNPTGSTTAVKPTDVGDATEVTEIVASKPTTMATDVRLAPDQAEPAKIEVRSTERSAAAEPREILRQAIEQIEKLQELRPPTRITLTLNPDNLGTIEVTITKTGGETHATLNTTHAAVHQALQQGKDQLLQAAEAKGLNFASFDLTQGQSQQDANQQLKQQDFERRVNLRANDPDGVATASPSAYATRSADGLDVRI